MKTETSPGKSTSCSLQTSLSYQSKLYSKKIPNVTKNMIDTNLNYIIGEKFRICKKLGEGATSKVYLCKHLKSNGYCAVKIIPIKTINSQSKFKNIEVYFLNKNNF